MKIAIPKERWQGEMRVAASPDTVKKLVGMGLEVIVEKGAGSNSAIPDDAFKDAGATIGSDPKATMAQADIVFKAIGQRLKDDLLDSGSLQLQNGKIVVDEDQSTSLPGIWAGGDCVIGGDDLTVSAVQHGKLAAISIDAALRGDKNG